MLIEEAFSKLLSLPPQRAMEEAISKLIDSTIRVNERLYYLVSININIGSMDLMEESGNKYNIKKVESLETFLPKTGLYYTTNNQPILLFKKPNRQWCRSFKKENYEVISLEKPDSILNIIEGSWKTFWVDSRKKLWYMNKIIGYIKNEQEVVCTNSLYEQEIKDWMTYE